jgi:predicted metal-dependent hydrolase
MLDDSPPQLPLWAEDTAAAGWAVRESRRARRLAVRVFHTGRVEVVVPRRTSRRAIAQFLDGHRLWIEAKLAHARRRAAAPEPFPPRAIELSGCDQSFRVHLAGGGGAVRARAIAPGILSLVGNASDPRLVQRALRAWLAERARAVLVPALTECAQRLGYGYRRVAIRRQRTRWGSCSTRGTISLNSCLLFQTLEVLRYLLVHELVHTRHMNHSRVFWREVARHCPQYQRLDAELLEGWRRVPSWVFGEARALRDPAPP